MNFLEGVYLSTSQRQFLRTVFRDNANRSDSHMLPLNAESDKVDNMDEFLVAALNAASDTVDNMDHFLVSVC